ncbi:MAG: DUF937 domain-containing protein [Anaerolineales bacterium]|nr:DUF937 domain-containing protein [Anaerolineales bacterium]
MDAISQMLTQQLAGGGLSQISQQIGADEQTTGNALSAAIPLLVSAMANNASQPEGAQSLHQALNQDHNGAIFNDMAGFLSNPQAANGAGILGHVLGAKQDFVQTGLAQQTGLDAGSIGQLLTIAAPLVMVRWAKLSRIRASMWVAWLLCSASSSKPPSNQTPT